MQKETFIKQYAAGLNPQQLAAVQAVHGPVLLLAVPGSGKTTVLVTRLGYMVLCCDVPPAQILTMTYTVAATHEMRGRFAARFGAELAGQMTFRTINGLSAVILQYYSRVYGRRQPELLTNEGDITRMLTDIWQQVNREFPTESTLKELRTAITYIKNMALADEEIEGLETDLANLPELYDRTIVVNGFSKSHAMTGWRMGYVCAPKPIIQCLTKLHQFGIMSAPTVSQYAAIEAMRNGDRDIEHMREEYDSRRRYLVENLRRIGLSCFEPKGAFYVFPDIRSTGLTSNEFCERFLREERVAVIPGSAFGPGGEGFVRACYAASMKDISEAITRMDNFLTNLRRSQGRG